jgi:hypothetical protein
MVDEVRPGEMRVANNGRGETVLHVHRWPIAAELPRTCSSLCADREPVNLQPPWRGTDDAAKIGQRLAAKDGQTSGKAKGRVLYLIETAPLQGGTQRVCAAALLSVKDAKTFRLYRMCFNADVIAAQHQYDSVQLVRCARRLAATAGARLQMLVPPQSKPGDLKLLYEFASVTRDAYGRSWLS